MRLSDSSAARLFFDHFIFKLPNQEVCLLFWPLGTTFSKPSEGYVLMFVNFDVFVIQPILEAKATGVWLDKNHRPIRIPQEARSKFVQFMRHEESN